MGASVTSGSGYYRQELKGAATLRRTLRQAGEDLEDLKEANSRAAKVVEGAAHQDVPKVTGKLDSTIRSSGTKTAGIIRAGRKSVPYAGVVQWGWPAHNITPQPFATDAAKRTEPTWGRIYTEAVDTAIARIKGI